MNTHSHTHLYMHLYWVSNAALFGALKKVTMEVKCSPYLGRIVITMKKRAMYYKCIFIFVVQSLSHVWLFATPWTVACQASLSFTICWSLLRLMSTESVIAFNLDDAVQRTISSSVASLSSCSQSFPASLFLPVSQLFPSGGQRTGASASASVLPMNIQDWSPLGWTGWISLQPKGLSRVLFSTTVRKHQSVCMHTNIHRRATKVCIYTHVILPYLDTDISR